MNEITGLNFCDSVYLDYLIYKGKRIMFHNNIIC